MTSLSVCLSVGHENSYIGESQVIMIKIWYTESDSDYDKNVLTKIQILNTRWLQSIARGEAYRLDHPNISQGR